MYLVCYLYVSSFVTEHTRYIGDTVQIHTNALSLYCPKIAIQMFTTGKCMKYSPYCNKLQP